MVNVYNSRNIKSGIGNIIYQNKIYTKDEDKAEIIGNYFSSQVNNDGNNYNTEYNYQTINNFNTRYTFPFVNKNIIFEIIKNLKIDTASGPDNISNLFIKKNQKILYI